MLDFPAWDCLPYDRVSPKPDIESDAAGDAVRAGAAQDERTAPAVVVTTVNAVLQRVPPREAICEAQFHARVGNDVDHDKLVRFLAAQRLCARRHGARAGRFRAARRHHRSVAAGHR